MLSSSCMQQLISRALLHHSILDAHFRQCCGCYPEMASPSGGRGTASVGDTAERIMSYLVALRSAEHLQHFVVAIRAMQQLA